MSAKKPAKPEGGYLAKNCAVRAQWDVLQPCAPIPPSPAAQRRMTQGMDFERESDITLAELYPDAAFIVLHGPENRHAREQLTLKAMLSGVQLIGGGRLPVDIPGRRVGEPDLLVKADGLGYRAVDIKHHLTLGGTTTVQAQAATLQDMAYEAAGLPLKARNAKNDLYQLAHYQRLLEACGYAADGPSYGGIIGKELQVVWYDIGPTLASYDEDFSDRLAIIDIANEHLADTSVPLAVAPVRITECGQCPWKDWCRAILEEGSGDLSLIPNMRQKARLSFISDGVTDRGALAALPVRGAKPTTAKLIDQARAVLGDELVYRQRGVTDTSAPRGDVEVDLDIENDELGVYLWGTLTTGSDEEAYRPFADWSLQTPESEAKLFTEFWAWFSALRDKTHAAGQIFRVYVYSSHERSNIRRIAARTDIDPEEFINSEDLVDLFAIFKAKLITGNPVGLKKTAPLSSFSWDVDEPGGDESMVRHDAAVQGDEAAREWLLSYNESDVQATLALRIWMSDEAANFRQSRVLGRWLNMRVDRRLKYNYDAVMKRDHDTCQYCGDVANSIDHVIPVSFMVDNTMGNLVAACMPCNLDASSLVFNTFEEKRRYVRQQRGLDAMPVLAAIAAPVQDASPLVPVVYAVWEELPDEGDVIGYMDEEDVCGALTYQGNVCHELASECPWHQSRRGRGR